jgi:nucleoside-diphosphate-sugar epimerase
MDSPNNQINHICCLGNSRLAQELKLIAQNDKSISVDVYSRADFKEAVHALSGILFISIRPVREDTEQYWNDFFKSHAERFSNVVLISTTSIYKTHEGKHSHICEDAPLVVDHPMVITERIVLKYFPKAIIIRPSGLFDDESHPVHFLAKKDNAFEKLNGTVNLVHRNDVSRAIHFLINQKLAGIFNASYPENPLKSQYYLNYANKLNLDLNGNPACAPKYPSKSIDTKKLLSLGYEYHKEI